MWVDSEIHKGDIHTTKKVPGIDHSKSPLKGMVKNLFDGKFGITVLYTDVEFECDLSFSLFTVLDVDSLSQVCYAIFPMDKNIEQRICLKFCIANGISCAESLKMLKKAYGESTLSKTREWYSCIQKRSRRGGRFASLWSAINVIK